MVELAQQRPLNVLVAEDCLFQQVVLLDFMELLEIHSAPANNGKEALE